MKVIDTSSMDPKRLNPVERDWVYNGLDACVTAEVLEALVPQLGRETSATYAFSKALQGPVLEMRLRGIKVDLARRGEVVEEMFERLDRLETNLERIVREGTGFIGFNWRSPDSLRRLFYDIFQIPEIRTREGRPTVNRAALEKMEAYSIAKPIISHMTAMRDLKKRIEVLKTEVDRDGRIRTSYNIAGTSTGRFSSSLSEFGTGGNLQNVEESLRSIFIADPGMKLANFDAEQGESRVVGAIEWNLFRDGKYLDACESGDLHTAVARICWPDLQWTNTLEGDRELAEHSYYRHYSRRFMCKKLGHGTNYGGKPQTMSAQTKTDIGIITDFQSKYFKAFPAHQNWHAWVEAQIRSYGRLTSLTGRLRHFFGRRDSPDILREAIAYDPQGSLADIVNRDMIKVWEANNCQLLMQNHDSILVQYPQEKEDEIVPKIQSLLYHELPLKHDRTLTIPYGCKTGWNWSEFCCGDRSRKGCEKCEKQTNLDGLRKYGAKDQRQRTPEVHILDRKIRRSYVKS
jgi:DNA polymerase I